MSCSNHYLSKEIDKIQNTKYNFTWKNKKHHLKNEILLASTNQGFEWLNFNYLKTLSKQNGLRNVLKPQTLFVFLFQIIFFKKLGGLHFLLTCNFSVTKLPLKRCYSLDLSTHKAILWNNEDIQKYVVYYPWRKWHHLFMNLFILYDKYHIQKCKYSKTSPDFKSFLCEFKEYKIH